MLELAHGCQRHLDSNIADKCHHWLNSTNEQLARLYRIAQITSSLWSTYSFAELLRGSTAAHKACEQRDGRKTRRACWSPDGIGTLEYSVSHQDDVLISLPCLSNELRTRKLDTVRNAHRLLSIPSGVSLGAAVMSETGCRGRLRRSGG